MLVPPSHQWEPGWYYYLESKYLNSMSSVNTALLKARDRGKYVVGTGEFRNWFNNKEADLGAMVARSCTWYKSSLACSNKYNATEYGSWFQDSQRGG